jgi:isopentenyl diphosphate isomerase/L-lactate dehydrogenase-like FMN-dependent dehydrogenase
MHRRTFAQLFAVGAGTIGLLHASGQETDDETAGKAPRNRPENNKSDVRETVDASDHLEPVNVHDFKTLAEARLPKATFDYITTGSADEITLKENVTAFQRIKVLPPLLKGVSEPDLSTTVLAQTISMPVMLAPVAAQRMYHPEGALAAARAAAAAKTVYGVSSSVGNSVEEVAGAGEGPKWFQLYVPRDRTIARKLVQRVERAGYEAIIVTVDLGEWKDADRRNRFALPKEMLVKHLRDVGYLQVNDNMTNQEVDQFNRGAWDLSLSWEFFDWLRGITSLPLLIKGVLRPDDAKKAVSIGLDGIIVSNHGGRRLDAMPASIAMLPRVVEAAGGRAEIFMDGGVRRGTDVLKAIALGAKAVLIGRPYAWALSAAGEVGVRQVLELFREETANAMVATGCATLADIDPTLLMP